MQFSPELTEDCWHWSGSHGDFGICFAGKVCCANRAPARGGSSLRLPGLPESVESAWLKQCHSATVVDAKPGHCGDGDALISSRRHLALTVVTADCVPVLIAAGERLAAVHAGWRGLAGSILGATLGRLEGPGEVTAWIGPAIGSCCYEVGQEVAEQVLAASSRRRDLITTGSRGRPHLDLVGAARAQLEAGGVDKIHTVGVCTKCDGDRLWSYRRDGAAAGRNVSAVWRT